MKQNDAYVDNGSTGCNNDHEMMIEFRCTAYENPEISRIADRLKEALSGFISNSNLN